MNVAAAEPRHSDDERDGKSLSERNSGAPEQTPEVSISSADNAVEGDEEHKSEVTMNIQVTALNNTLFAWIYSMGGECCADILFTLGYFWQRRIIYPWCSGMCAHRPTTIEI